LSVKAYICVLFLGQDLPATKYALPLAGFQGINQKDVEVEKTGETAQKGLEKAGQNLIPDEIKNSAVGDTSELPNPFDGAGGIADKVFCYL